MPRPALTVARRLAVTAAVIALTWAPASAAAQAERPNIVVILADDMGYSDVGAYGGEIHTPNLDRLAEQGLRFRHFYNAARCSPTRAALLTGRHPHEVGMGDLAPGLGQEREPGAYQGYFPAGVPTIADALRAAGYRTYLSGKWHVGDDVTHWPGPHGFNRHFGLIGGATSFFELLQEGSVRRFMALDGESWTPPAQGYYATDAYTDYAVERIREHRTATPDRPFFLYLAYTAPHFPLHAPPEDIARYRGRYDVGWDRIRAERYRRMRQMGVLTEAHALAPRPDAVPAWENAGDRDDWARRMEVYAAMVDRMDQGIGRVMQALRETGQERNTLVLFLSDNGASPEDVSGRRLNDPSVPVGARGSYVGYQEPWAYASNTPFRLYKSWVHEGGIITPLIAHWPAGIRETGRFTDQVGHVMDILPTALELAGAPGLELEGRSFVPVLRGGPPADRAAPLFWAQSGNWAVREGRWKLVYDSRRARQMELFDLAADPTELRDLAAEHPERVAEMRATWQRWAERVGARERLAR